MMAGMLLTRSIDLPSSSLSSSASSSPNLIISERLLSPTGSPLKYSTNSALFSHSNTGPKLKKNSASITLNIHPLINIHNSSSNSVRHYSGFVQRSPVYLPLSVAGSRAMSIVNPGSGSGADGGKDGSANQSLSAEEERVKALKVAKRSLRRSIDAKLATLTPDEVNSQSARVHAALFDSPAYRDARRIGLYLSLPGGEIHTQPILERAFADGKQVFVPSYDFRTRQMEFYEIKSMAEYDSLPVEPKYLIKQPELANPLGRKEALSTGGLDLLLCPGVCFTKDGKRLGHGRGYFDTWLGRMSQMANITRPRCIALALKQQMVDDLPTHEWDFIMDRILSPDDN